MAQDPTSPRPNERTEASAEAPRPEPEQPAPGDRAATTRTCPVPGEHVIATSARGGVRLKVRCDGSVGALDLRTGPYPWSTQTGPPQFLPVPDARVDLPGAAVGSPGGWHAAAADAAGTYLRDLTGETLKAGQVADVAAERCAWLEEFHPRLAQVEAFAAAARELRTHYQAMNRDDMVTRHELMTSANPVGRVVAEYLTDGEPDPDVLFAVAVIEDVDAFEQQVYNMLDAVNDAIDGVSLGDGVPAALAVLDHDVATLLKRTDATSADAPVVYLSDADARTVSDVQSLSADPTGWLRRAGVLPPGPDRDPAAAEPQADPDMVKVFSAPHCPACDATVRSLTKAGVPFEKVELESLDPQERAEVVAGHLQAPVVQAPGVGTWDGHRPTQIERLIATRAAPEPDPEPDGPR